MKKIVLILILFCISLNSYSQTIKENSLWFDGHSLYTSYYDNGKVYFAGYSEHNIGQNFCLRPAAGTSGLYYLAPENETDKYPKFRTVFGAKARYIRQEGMNFIALYNAADEIVWTFVLTPDELSSCLSSQAWAQGEPFSEMVSGYLMNPAFLSSISRAELSNQLSFLERKSSKSIIEKVNADLIRNELRLEDSERRVGPAYVSTAKEFLSAIKPNTTIIIEENAVINLSEVLGRSRPSNFLQAESVYDGMQLNITNVDRLTIIGENNSSIVVEPRYAYVLNFINCHFINIKNITIGHTEKGYCMGGVIGLNNCSDVFINDSDMYGCGTYGIVADNVTGLNVDNSIIRDCSYGIMILNNVSNAGFASCDFYNNKEFSLVEIHQDCKDIGFFDCRFFGNEGHLFDVRTSTLFYDCLIYHSSSDSMGIDRDYMNFSGENNVIKVTSQVLQAVAGPDKQEHMVEADGDNPAIAKVAVCKNRKEGLDMIDSVSSIDAFIYGAWEEGEHTFVVIPQKQGVHLELWAAGLNMSSYDIEAQGSAPIAKARDGQALCFSYIVPEGAPSLMVIAVDESGYQSSWIPQFSGEDGSLIIDSDFVLY